MDSTTLIIVLIIILIVINMGGGSTEEHFARSCNREYQIPGPCPVQCNKTKYVKHIGQDNKAYYKYVCKK